MDRVEKIDAKLARMEYWAESRSEPFPEGVRNAIADLRASFDKQDTETIPADTATTAIYETTTTTAATADDSNSAVTRIKQQYNKEPEVRREREWRRRMERANERPSGER
jgi:hypothetical protein